MSSLLSALLLLSVALGIAAGAAAGPAVVPVSIAAGALVVVALGDTPWVATGFAFGGAVDSAASSAPLTNGTGVAGINSVAVGGSSTTSVGSSIS